MSTKLKPGSKAPDFEAEAWNGERIQLAKYQENRVWIAFFRYASCPLCNLRIRDMIRHYPELAARGLKILAVFQSPKESVSDYVGKQNPPFPLICDPKENLYRLYGLESSWAGFFHPGNLSVFKTALSQGFHPGRIEGTLSRVPGDFLIDSTGSIQEAFYGEKIGDHIPFERVFNFLDQGEA